MRGAFQLPGWKVKAVRWGHYERGLTLVELLLVLALLGLAAAAVGGFYLCGIFAWRKGVDRMDSQQNARAAMELVDRELRFAHWVDVAKEDGEIRYGLPSDPQGDHRRHFRRFRLWGGQRLLEQIVGGSTYSSNVAAGGISAVSFQVDGDGRVLISITAGSGESAVTLQSSVRPRNLPETVTP